MQNGNRITLKVHGKYALFTDPLTKIGGEKCSYHIPTYEAIKGILSSVYWKPTFTWFVDKIRVIKPVKTQTKGVKPIRYSGGNDLSIYTYLSDVEYQVQAHFEWNMHRSDMEKDRNEGKHFSIATRMVQGGGRRDIFLGARECQGYVEPCGFNDGPGAYDNSGEVAYGLMFHGFDYPDESGISMLAARFWNPKMVNGVINFVRPEECAIRKNVRTMHPNPPESSGLKEEGLVL